MFLSLSDLSDDGTQIVNNFASHFSSVYVKYTSVNIIYFIYLQVIGTLGIFDMETDVKIYFARLKNCFAANGITEESNKRAILYSPRFRRKCIQLFLVCVCQRTPIVRLLNSSYCKVKVTMSRLVCRGGGCFIYFIGIKKIITIIFV